MALVRKISADAELTRDARASEMGQGMASSSVEASSQITRERYRGALLGLAAGDALGTTLEFKPPGTFTPLDDMIGGGPFYLKPGEWTDDTSMALCLAESLIEKRGFDAKDQMDRYCSWYERGHLSSTGRCFDIGKHRALCVRDVPSDRQPFFPVLNRRIPLGTVP